MDGRGEIEQERRRHPRQGRKVNLTVRQLYDGSTAEAHVVNISRGGVMMATDRELPLGTRLELHFPENVFGTTPHTLQGIVRWIQSRSSKPAYRLGTMFVRIRPRERRRSPRTAHKMILKIRCVMPAQLRDTEPRAAILNNISKGGMELHTTREYPPGARLEIEIPATHQLPGSKVFGLVRWNRPADQAMHFRLGLSLE